MMHETPLHKAIKSLTYKFLHSTHPQQERVAREVESYKASLNPSSTHKRSYREVLARCLQEQEVASKALRDKQKMVRDSHAANLDQLSMWTDLQKLMACKLRCLQQQQGGMQQMSGSNNGLPQLQVENRLVL